MKKKLFVMFFAVMMLALTFMPGGAIAATYYATGVGGNQIAADPPAGSTVGTEFTVIGSSFTAYQLGVYDAGSDGLGQSHPVGIYTTGGALLASATVPSGTAAPIVNGFRWVSLTTPLTLNAGTSYVLAAYYPASGDTFGTTAVIDPNFTLVRNRYIDQAGLNFPAQSWADNTTGWYGPNMATPIPAAIWLLGSGLVGLVALRRRKSA